MQTLRRLSICIAREAPSKSQAWTSGTAQPECSNAVLLRACARACIILSMSCACADYSCGCMDYGFRRPKEPWEASDGAVYLLRELAQVCFTFLWLASVCRHMPDGELTWEAEPLAGLILLVKVSPAWISCKCPFFIAPRPPY